MMHNSIQGWQRRCRTQPGVRVWRRGNPFFHFLFFPLTTDLQNWEERCFAFGRNRKLAEKMGLSKRCLQNINNAWGLVTVIICRWNLLLMGERSTKAQQEGAEARAVLGGTRLNPHSCISSCLAVVTQCWDQLLLPRWGWEGTPVSWEGWGRVPTWKPEQSHIPASYPGNRFNNLRDGHAVQTKQDATSKLSCNDPLRALY